VPDEIATQVQPALDELNRLLSAPAYDVGKYDRIIGQIGGDLKTVEKSLNDAVLAAEKEYAKAAKAAAKTEAKMPKAIEDKMNDLRAARDDISARIINLERVENAEDAATVGRLHDAMDGMPAGYTEGIDPYPGMAGEAPSSLEEGIIEELEQIRLAEGEADLVRKTVSPTPETTPETIEAAQAAVAKSDAIDDFGPLGQARKIDAGHYELDTPFGVVEIVKEPGKNNWWVKTPIPEFRTGLKKSKRYTSIKKAREDVKKVITDEAIGARKVRKDWSEQARSEARMPEGARPIDAPAPIAPEIEKPKMVKAGQYELSDGTTIERVGKEWRIKVQGEEAYASHPTLKAAMEDVQGGRMATHEEALAKHAQRDIVTEEVIPGQAAPAARPYMEGEDAVVAQVFDQEQLRKLRQELGATDEEIRTLAQARVDDGADLKLIEDDAREAELFNQKLPDRPNQLMSLEEVDRIAKAAALTATQDLLYDLSKRSNFSDMMRNIFPFSEAWFEIVSTWSRLIQGNPRTVRRFQQAYDGIKEDVVMPESAFSVEGHDGHGFFYVDPKTKKEMFAIPYMNEMLQGNVAAGGVIGGAIGAGMGGLYGGAGGAIAGGIAGAAAGACVSQAGLVPEGENVGLAFSAQGMNMMTGSVMPGLGPLAALPVSWVLNATGKMGDPIKDLFLPFGEPNVSSVGDFIDNMLPSWAQKFVMAAGGMNEDQRRIRANTTMEVAGMMVRRGEGSFSSQAEIKSTLEAASKKSGWLYAIRGLASFAGPTSPVFDYNTEDKNGAWFYTNTMVNEWRKTVDNHGGDEVSAFNEFTGLYGLMPQTFMSGKTKALVNAPTTVDAYAWKKENEELYDKYPGTAYLLNPVDPLDDEFSYPAYLESLREGTRVAYTPTQWAEKSNQLAANVIMERFRQSATAFLADSPHKSVDQVKVDRQMHDLQRSLMNEYPGYNRQIMGDAAPMDIKQKLDEIRHWSPAMKASEVGQAVESYMFARDEAEAIGSRAGYSSGWWQTSMEPEAVEIRDQLIAISAMLYRQTPGFKSAWHTLFASEIRAHIEETN